MTKDWMHNARKSSGRYSEEKSSFNWDKSSSEPDLSDPNSTFGRRWSKGLLHEYTSIDELKFFHHHGPTDLHTRSSFSLYDKDMPFTPFSLMKSEYTRQFKGQHILRPSLIRKHTTLKLSGQMDKETEHKSNFLPYTKEQVLKCRPSPFKNPEHLKLSGEYEFFPEYKSSFIEHSLVKRRVKNISKENIKTEGLFDVMTTTTTNDNQNKEKVVDKNTAKLPISLSTTTTNCLQKTSPLTTSAINKKTKNDINYCNDVGRGNSLSSLLFSTTEINQQAKISDMPTEYRSKYVQFPIEKSKSIPQLSSIHFNGIFNGIPEYRENFKFYDSYSKSAPIKKDDHNIISNDSKVNNNFVTVPEYKEKFKEPPSLTITKPNEMISESVTMATTAATTKNEKTTPSTIIGDTLNSNVTNFKDKSITTTTKINQLPHNEPFLRLKERIEFNPEYRSIYLDYPTKSSSINDDGIVKPSCYHRHFHCHHPGYDSITPESSSTLSSKHLQKKFRPPILPNYNDPNDELPFLCQPEYRKAKHDYLIKERPLSRLTPENQTVDDGRIISQNLRESAIKVKKNDKKLKSTKIAGNKKKLSTTTTTTSDLSTSPQKCRYISNSSNHYHQQSNIVDTFDENKKSFTHKKVSPKFGRRASIKCKTKQIESNQKCCTKDLQKKFYRDESFVILDKPSYSRRDK